MTGEAAREWSRQCEADTNKYKVFAWRSRLLGTLKYAGDGGKIWDMTTTSPGDLGRRMERKYPEVWRDWLVKFPGADIEYLDSLGNHPDEMFNPRPKGRTNGEENA